jgi:Concanavalin A-like lectin/glucanases superfamily
MAYECASASNQYFTIAAPNISVPPVTFSIWINATSIVDKNTALFIWRDVIQTGLLLRYVAPNWELRYYIANGTQWQTATGLFVSTGIWQHVCVAVSSTQARLYLNGSTFTNNVSHATTNINAAGDVARDPAPSVVSFQGSIAEPAIWNATLTDAECRALGNGLSPLCLKHRLPSLVMYRDLIRDPNRGFGPALTPVNAPTVAPHPPMRYPHGRLQTMFSPAHFLAPFRPSIATAQASPVAKGDAELVGAARGTTQPVGEVTS